MVRRRLAPAVAKATGATTKNPGRFEGRNDPRSPLLGDPSKWLTAAQKRAWKLFKDEMPWLVESDRPIVDVAATVRERFNSAKGGISLNELQIYSAVLSKLGATPVDRSRTSPLDPEREPDEFFGD